MRPTLFESVLPFDQALAVVIGAATPIERVVTVPLSDADGRVSARDVTATHDVPAFDRAAMDGYAVVADDTAGATPSAPRALRLVGGVFTGDMPARGVTSGECMEIATGAPLPAGATAVVMVEDTVERTANTSA